MGLQINNNYPRDPNGSDILANPNLQYPREDVVDHITDKVEEAVNVKRDTFNLKQHNVMNYIVMAATVAAAAIAILAFVTLNATGIGSGLIALTAVLGGLAVYMAKDFGDKQDLEPAVNAVYRDANRQRIGKTIDNYQRQDESGIEMAYLRPAPVQVQQGPRGRRPVVPMQPQVHAQRNAPTNALFI